MSARQKEWARRTRETLLESFGRACAACGSREMLEFDCIVPQGHTHHRMSFDRRMSFYRHQKALDNLQVLCKPCQTSKGNQATRYIPTSANPF